MMNHPDASLWRMIHHYEDRHVKSTNMLPASAEGLVKDQNLNQTAALLSSG